jgi:hypothetical protein
MQEPSARFEPDRAPRSRHISTQELSHSWAAPDHQLQAPPPGREQRKQHEQHEHDNGVRQGRHTTYGLLQTLPPSPKGSSRMRGWPGDDGMNVEVEPPSDIRTGFNGPDRSEDPSGRPNQHPPTAYRPQQSRPLQQRHPQSPYENQNVTFYDLSTLTSCL